jgi:hypothetical protein
MNTYLVTIPIAGHITFEVNAESPKEAEDKAMEMNADEGQHEWEMLQYFHQGNICYCPSPWKITTEQI